MSKRIPTVDLFLGASLLALLLGGTYLGGRLVATLAGVASSEQWPALLATHARLQTVGFLVLFTFGVSLLVLPRFLGAPSSTPSDRSPLALACFACMSLGLLLGLLHQNCPVARGVLVLGTVFFLAELRRLRRAAPGKGSEPADPLNRLHALYLASGTVWLLVALVRGDLDLLLWGFGGLYVLGVGQRVHPQILEAPRPCLKLIRLSLLLAQGGLLCRLFEAPLPGAVLWLGTAVVYLVSLRPHRWNLMLAKGKQSWLVCYVIASYAWLLAASTAAVLLSLSGSENVLEHGAVRHLFATGFLCTMMVGMGFRIVPSFSGRSAPWDGFPLICFFALTGGNVLRIVWQVLDPTTALFLLGGALQASALLLFALSILATLARPSRLSPEALSRPWLGLVPPASDSFASPASNAPQFS